MVCRHIGCGVSARRDVAAKEVMQTRESSSDRVIIALPIHNEEM
jgi:hypothetical protein